MLGYVKDEKSYYLFIYMSIPRYTIYSRPVEPGPTTYISPRIPQNAHAKCKMQQSTTNINALNHLFPHLSIYPKSGNPSKIPLITSSSSAFLSCAAFVAPVSG